MAPPAPTLVRDLMSTPAFCVRATDDVAHARQEMVRRGVTHLPVVGEDGAPRSMLGVEDLIAALPPREDPKRPPAATLAVGKVMRAGSGAVRLLLHETVRDAARQLLNQRATCAPVVQEGRVVGVVSVADLLGAVAPQLAGRARVRDVARASLPQVPRHASVPHVLRTLQEAQARDAAVVEGKADLSGRSPGTLERGSPHAPDPGDFGIVGWVSLRSILGSAWFEHASRGEGYGKFIAETRRAEAGGPKTRRHVEDVGGLAEDMMHEVRWLAPDDDAAHAARAFAETGATGFPVLAAELRAPMFLDRQELLAALLQRVATA
jgi:CBS domain-containing protein